MSDSDIRRNDPDRPDRKPLRHEAQENPEHVILDVLSLYTGVLPGAERSGSDSAADASSVNSPVQIAWFITFYSDDQLLACQWVGGGHAATAEDAVATIIPPDDATAYTAVAVDVDQSIHPRRKRQRVELTSAESLALENEDPRLYGEILRRMISNSGYNYFFLNE